MRVPSTACTSGREIEVEVSLWERLIEDEVAEVLGAGRSRIESWSKLLSSMNCCAQHWVDWSAIDGPVLYLFAFVGVLEVIGPRFSVGQGYSSL